MTSIRPFEPDDLSAVVRLYTEMDNRDPSRPPPGFTEFFDRVLVRAPLADPEIPSLVCEVQGEGLVGMVGSHVRPFTFGDRKIRIACAGPLFVRPEYRPKGVGGLLLRRFIGGAQEITVNDRTNDDVRSMWMALGGVVDSSASIRWRRVLAPVGAAVHGLLLGRLDRQTPPGGGAFAAADAVAGRRRRPPEPAVGTTESLTAAGLIDLRERLRRQYDLRPAYDERTIEALFAAMETVDIDGELVRRRVVGEDGQPLGAFVMYASRHGAAQVIGIVTGRDQAGEVLSHLVRDAWRHGAVVVGGRVEPHLLPHLRSPGFLLEPPDSWVTAHSREPDLLTAMTSGRALISRLDGEWWMRPRPEPS